MQSYVNITPSTLPTMIFSLLDKWDNARATGDLLLVPRTGTLDGILKKQTADLRELSDPTNKQEHDIYWIPNDTLPVTTESGVVTGLRPLAISGTPLSTSKQTVSIDQNIFTSFEVPMEIILSNPVQADVLIERGMLLAFKTLKEDLNVKALAHLITNAGKNLYQDDLGLNGNASGVVANDWKITAVPYANLFPESIGNYLYNLQEINNVHNFDLFSGGVFNLDQRVSNDVYSPFKFGDFVVNTDIKSFAAASIKKDFFAVSDGAVALVSRHKNPNGMTNANEEIIAGVKRLEFSMPLPGVRDTNGQAVMVDIYTEDKHVQADTADHFNRTVTNRGVKMRTFYFEVHFKYLTNPSLMQTVDGVNGIFRFTADSRAVINTPVQAYRTFQ